VKQFRPFLVMDVEKNGLVLVWTAPVGRKVDIVPVESRKELVAGIVAGVCPSWNWDSNGACLAE
jgi:hypothetical protein